MSDRGTLETLASELALAFQPLASALQSPEAARDFLEELGWDFAAAPAAINALQGPVESLFELADGADDASPADVVALVDAIRSAVTAIEALAGAGGVSAEFASTFPRQLVDYLLVEYFLENQPRWGRLLQALGIIRLEERPAAGGRPAYLHRTFALDELGAFLGDPLGYVGARYNWGQSDFRDEELLERLSELLTAWGAETRMSGIAEATLTQLAVGATQPDEVFDSALEIVLFEDNLDPATLSAGIALFILPETATAKPGLALLPFVTGEASIAIDIAENLALFFETAVELTGTVGLLLRPATGVELLAGLDGGTPSAISGEIAAGVRYGREGAPTILLGAANESRLQIGTASLAVGSRFHSSRGANAYAELTLEKAAIVISPGEDADGFLSEILPQDGIEFEFDVTVGVSTDEGLYFRGSAELEVRLPLHLSLGPIEIGSALLAIRVPSTATSDFGVDVNLGADVAADFSVLQATVENLGVRATFAVPDDSGGNLGPVDFSMGFKPPNGVGLAIDAGVVKGGGYLFLDYEKGEYAGALELVFSGYLALKAIGLINTRMPDGSDGFSMVIIVTAEFGTPIQLGFGFVLIGVGGLLGLNRTMMLEELAEGVRTGSVESIMFPEDVIANAPQIISDMRRFFPPEEETFLIGPMAKLGWGTPALVTASLGIIIEVPPGNIAILGVLKCVLPDEDAALLVLQVKFIGALEVDKSRLWFFASLFGSRVLFISLGGEMGLLIAWGDNAEFVLSVGGFHPSFSPPPMPFPSPQRVSLSILNESFARIRVTGYFAVTSNTAQFGAAVEIFVGVSAFSLQGHLGFDALFQFSPFYFIISFSASVSVKVFGAGLFSIRFRGQLEGTSPWHVEGEGSISILFWSIDIPFSHTWGDSADTVLPEIDAMPILQAEFEKRENWLALPPAGAQISVSLRTIEATEELVLHPVGALRISQRAVPLDLSIQKIGNQAVRDIEKASLLVNAPGLVRKAVVRESFATAQYREMDAAAKLSAPGYETQVAGADVSVSGNDTRTSHAVKRIVLHELITIDNNFKEHVRRFFNIGKLWFTQLLSGNSTARSKLSMAAKKAKVPFDAGIVAAEPGYVIARASDNSAWGGAATFASHAEAQDALAAQARTGAGEELHVIPAAEVRQAA